MIAFPGRSGPVDEARMLVRHGYGVLLLDMGMNRRSHRVFVYATLLRDEYPPCRFDGGEREQVAAPLSSPQERSLD